MNGRYTGFLVKNMPIEDDIIYGRIKDLVAVIIEALSNGVEDLSVMTARITDGVLARGSPFNYLWSVWKDKCDSWKIVFTFLI